MTQKSTITQMYIINKVWLSAFNKAYTIIMSTNVTLKYSTSEFCLIVLAVEGNLENMMTMTVGSERVCGLDVGQVMHHKAEWIHIDV